MPKIVLTNHVKLRLLERNIDVHDIKMVVVNGKVTKTEPDGTLIKVGICDDKKTLAVVYMSIGSKFIIKTAYYES